VGGLVGVGMRKPCPCIGCLAVGRNNDHELYRLALWTAQAILLPYVRKNVENNELMNAAPLLELFEREISIRSYSGPKKADKSGHKVPHKISQVLERMPISSLVGVACRRQGKGHFPRLLQKAMKDIRSDLSGTDYMSW